MSRKIRPRIGRRSGNRKGRKVLPTKIAALVVSAIQDLRETKGSTPSKIIGYISYVSEMNDDKVKRQVKAVLKRGLEYGILRKYRRQYYLPTSNELNRANRIALRFAKLPLPSTYQTKSRSFYSLRSKRRNSRKSNVKSSRKAKQLADFSSTLISPTVSLANTICNVDDL
ncbi:uncharacterized protein LOC108001087 [Apis cerana]|uniref:uncharacterized protein LOC108001087 n=1 Tax=Apis cerana TaxID=7461 RepID=UPI0007E2B4AC|nr:uncharacterized protein LOC108001087 [Apis cerana]